jgi:chromosome segregation ATPase
MGLGRPENGFCGGDRIKIGLKSNLRAREWENIVATKEEYLSQVEAQLPKFDAELTFLRARIGSARCVDMDDCGEQVDKLCTKYTILRLRLQLLKEADEERWEQRRQRIERAIGELSSSLDNLGAWVWVRSAE